MYGAVRCGDGFSLFRDGGVLQRKTGPYGGCAWRVSVRSLLDGQVVGLFQHGLGQGFGNFDVQGAEPLGSADEVAGAGAELFHRLVVVALHGVDILADCFERSDESDEFVVHHGPLAGDAVGVASEVVAFPEVVHNLEHAEEVRG